MRWNPVGDIQFPNLSVFFSKTEQLCRDSFSVVSLTVIFDVTALLNVTDLLSTDFWITATDSLIFSATNRKNLRCHFMSSQLGRIRISGESACATKKLFSSLVRLIAVVNYKVPSSSNRCHQSLRQKILNYRIPLFSCETIRREGGPLLSAHTL